ncbi:MAG: hypothetical protein QXK49_00075 [Candidatus Aenigmatarchaeota archaeon]
MEGPIDCKETEEVINDFLSYLESIGEVTNENGAPIDHTNWNRKIVITPYEPISKEEIKETIRTGMKIYNIKSLKWKLL